MSNSRTRLCSLITALLFLLPAMDTQAQSSNVAYRAETIRWRASDSLFNTWQRDGVALTFSRALQLDPQKAHAGTDLYGWGNYRGGNFYNGGSFFVGEAIGPVITAGFPFSEAIPSWNADTPPGSWIEAQLRARTGGAGSHWTRWYSMGVWASVQETVKRHSVSGQADADAYVDVDTLKIGKPGNPLAATAYQLKLSLFSTTRNALPSIRSAAVAVSTRPTTPGKLTPGNPARWDKLLSVPECSQMLYPDGGEAWCSPTSVAMVLAYWKGQSGSPASCEAGVRRAVSGIYDRIYGGTGNWPFNAAYAYAADKGMESYVTRFTGMSQAEEWIAKGVPVIISYGWGRGQLTGAPLHASNGHLAVLVGFDAKGNPIVNDPAAPSNQVVQRTYSRAELERLWLQGSGGTAYLIYPLGRY